MPAHSTNVKPCIVCGVRKGYQAGGLCARCYRTPGVRVPAGPSPHRMSAEELLTLCPQCGQQFSRKQFSDRRRFCSKKCGAIFSGIKKTTDAVERFWSKVEKTDGCWNWLGAVGVGGYGRFWISDEAVSFAHRFSYELAYGPIPDDKLVCHHCDNPRCVRPDHFFVGTHADNTNDARNKGRLATGDRSGSRLHPERLKRGEQNARAKLTEDQVREIRRLAGSVTQAELAKRFGVAACVIGFVIHRKTWKHVD